MQTQPLVNVIIPTYNREKLLPRAINSVLSQTYQNWELIIVDDRSTDNTQALMQEYVKKDTRIKYIKNTHKQGPGGARNQGIEVAKGEYIAFLDSDDFWEKDKLEIQLTEMINKKNSFSCTLVKFINYECEQMIKSGHVFNELLRFSFIATPSVILRKEIMDSMGLFDESLFTSSDLDLWLRISKKFELLYIEKPLATVARIDQHIIDTALQKTGKLPDYYRDRLKIFSKLKKMRQLDREQIKIIRKFISDQHFTKAYNAWKKKNKLESLFHYFISLYYYFKPFRLGLIKRLFISKHY